MLRPLSANIMTQSLKPTQSQVTHFILYLTLPATLSPPLPPPKPPPLSVASDWQHREVANHHRGGTACP